MLCDNGGEKLLLLAEGLLKKHVASHSLHDPEGAFFFSCFLYFIFSIVCNDLNNVV